MDPRLVCVDIDGTLINARQEIPDSSRRAIRAGIQAGNVFVLCTGRSLPEVYPWLWDLGFAGIIGGSGAFTRLGAQTVTDHRISNQDLRTVSALLDSHGFPWVWQTPTHLHPSPSFLEAFAGRAAHAAGGDNPDAVVPDGTGAQAADPADWSPYLRQISSSVRPGLPESASKGTFMVPRGEELRPGTLEEATEGRLRSISGSVESAWGTTCEVLLSGVDKGTALTELAARLGIPRSHTVAIGDSVNDIEALEAAGTGVAMGNASPLVKQMADMVTGNIDNAGLSCALEELGLTA